MIVWTERYIITTLCKPDIEAIEKTQTRFRDIVGKIMNDNPEFRGHIMIGNERIRKRHDIEFSGKKIPVVRLEWTIAGDRYYDLPEAFFRKWRECDTNPLRSFHVKPDYSISEIIELMEIGKEKINEDL